MSGRKKNRKHQRSQQPPHELLKELSSLRDLLGTDMQADIPLLNQVAEPTLDEIADSNNASGTPAQKASTPTQSPAGPSAQQQSQLAPPRPLQEADLPILFSPVDEEPAEEFTSQLSDTDRELLRPLQELPRQTESATSDPKLTPEIDDDQAIAEQVNEQNADQDQEPADEFQPSLFDAQQKPEARSDAPKLEEKAKPAPKSKAEKAAKGKKRKKNQKLPSPQSSENPFLPPHIRARLTGGRVPRAEAEPSTLASSENSASLADKEPEAELAQATGEPASNETGSSETGTGETGINESAASEQQPAQLSERDLLIEQLVAEQLPELERQLRINITELVDEIYNKG